MSLPKLFQWNNFHLACAEYEWDKRLIVNAEGTESLQHKRCMNILSAIQTMFTLAAMIYNSIILKRILVFFLIKRYFSSLVWNVTLNPLIMSKKCIFGYLLSLTLNSVQHLMISFFSSFKTVERLSEVTKMGRFFLFWQKISYLTKFLMFWESFWGKRS